MSLYTSEAAISAELSSLRVALASLNEAAAQPGLPYFEPPEEDDVPSTPCEHAELDLQLMVWALELAQTIANKSPLSIGLAKQTLNAIEDMSLRDGYRYEQDMTAAIAKTEDAKEAQRAFLEKRSAVFVGR